MSIEGVRVSVVVECEDRVLHFTNEDLDDLEISTPYDVNHEGTPETALGQAHFVMNARFIAGKRPRWRD